MGHTVKRISYANTKGYASKLVYFEGYSGRILMLRGPKGWSLPGGTREEGEDAFSCLTRELNEEIRFVPPGIRYVGLYQQGEWTSFVFTARGPGIINSLFKRSPIQIDNEIFEAKWVPILAVKKHSPFWGAYDFGKASAVLRSPKGSPLT